MYEAMVGSANRNLATTVAGLDYQKGQLGQIYGLGVNAQGSVFDDPSNPFSRAAALAQSYKRAQTGTTNSMAASGQLYAGSLQNAQNENANQNARGRDAMIRQFLADNQQIDQARLQAANAYQDEVTRAQAERIQRALENRPDPASVPAIGGAATPAAARAKPKPGYQFVQDSGSRKGLSYKLVPGKNGELIRLYENGDRVAR
jgi:hypothetical protein